MTSAQRLEKALHGEKPDRLPCICPGGMMNMITAELMEHCGVFWPEAHTASEQMAELASASYEAGLFDNIGVPFCMTVEAEAMGAGTDLGDRLTEPRVEQYAIRSVEDWQQLKRLDPSEGRSAVVIEAIRLIRKKHPDAAVMGNLTGPISTASSAADASVFYKELRKKKEAAHAMLDFVTEQLITFGLAQIEAGAEFITISDPSGTGEILGPKLFEEYALPALNRICDALKPRCKGVIVHICGRLQSIYPQLCELHSDALSFDAIVSVKGVRENVPGKAVMGNISTFAMADGTLKTVGDLCRSAVANGVDILAPACGLGTKTPLEAIRILMRTSEECA